MPPFKSPLSLFNSTAEKVSGKAMSTMPFLNTFPAYDRVRDESEEREPTLQKPRERSRMAWHLLLVAFCLSLMANGFLLFRNHRAGTKEDQLIGVSKPFFPIGPDYPMAFLPTAPYNETKSHDSDSAWASLVPRGLGSLELDDPKEFNLPPSYINKQGKTVYGVTVFHQLHCLQSIRDYLFTSISGEESSSHHHGRSMARGTDHITHCFDFLRQGVMCQPDLTLEPTFKRDGGLVDNGQGTAHRCKDYSKVLEYASKHLYYKDAKSMSVETGVTTSSKGGV